MATKTFDETRDDAAVSQAPVTLTSAQTAELQVILDELNALPEGAILSKDEIAAIVRRMPGRPPEWTSADVIREYRGALPTDGSNVGDVGNR
jgi:hypothetical protein